MEFDLCRPAIPEHGACPGVWVTYRCVGEGWYVFSQRVSAEIVCWFEVALCAGILSSLNLCRSWAYFRHLCEFIWASSLLWLEDTVSLLSSAISYDYHLPLPAGSHEPWGTGLLIRMSHLGLSALKSVTLCTLSTIHPETGKYTVIIQCWQCGRSCNH